MSSNNQTTQKRRRRKKKRIAKHVREAKHKQVENNDNDNNNKITVSNHKAVTATTYLQEWKSAHAQWKFRKNMQSWILRNLYEIPKATFGLALEYCEGLQGSIRARTCKEARQYAQRYKQYEKNKNEKNKETEENKETENKEANDNDKATNEKEDSPVDNETWWEGLDDHGKRKVYKRARKVMEALKE